MAEAAPGGVFDDNKRRDRYEDPANRWGDSCLFFQGHFRFVFLRTGCVWGDKSIDGRIASIDRSIRDGMDSLPKVGAARTNHAHDALDDQLHCTARKVNLYVFDPLGSVGRV